MTIGDFATTRVDGTFRLAYLVFNTIMNLTTQDEQVECFRNVAAHLEPGGCFVIEVGVPALQRLPPGETVRAFTVSPTHARLRRVRHRRADLFSHHYWVVDGQLEIFSAPYRYVWPSELDLMARTRRHDLARALERLEPRAVHERQHDPRLGLGEGEVAIAACGSRDDTRRHSTGGVVSWLVGRQLAGGVVTWWVGSSAGG